MFRTHRSDPCKLEGLLHEVASEDLTVNVALLGEGRGEGEVEGRNIREGREETRREEKNRKEKNKGFKSLNITDRVHRIFFLHWNEREGRKRENHGSVSESMFHLRMHVQHVAEPCSLHPLKVPPVMLQLVPEGLVACRVMWREVVVCHVM